MKLYTRALLNALVALSAYTVIPANATETLNLSFADAAVTEYDGCVGTAVGWMAKDPYQIQDVNGCQVEFALPVPVGHLIRQISVLHGTSCENSQPCADPNVIMTSAAVLSTVISGPWAGLGDYHFVWSSNEVDPLGSIVTKPLMVKPDQFITLGDTAYRVQVKVRNFAFVAGLQITYD